MKKLAFVIVASALCADVAFVQAAAAQAPSSSDTRKVEKWTTEEWNSAKAEWSKDKAKWVGCQLQSTDQKLTGRKSWSFLYTCMNT